MPTPTLNHEVETLHDQMELAERDGDDQEYARLQHRLELVNDAIANFEYYAGDYAGEGEPDLIVSIVSEDALADANLIAQSPDLLSLCEYTLAALTMGELVFTQPDDPEKLKNYVTFVGRLERAIGKVTGGSE